MRKTQFGQYNGISADKNTQKVRVSERKRKDCLLNPKHKNDWNSLNEFSAYPDA